MKSSSSFETCRGFIDSQWHPRHGPGIAAHGVVERPTITISRATGSGARSIAEELADYMRQADPEASCPWRVFDRNLVHKILEDHDLPRHLHRYLPDERIAGIDYAVEELLGLHPSAWTMVAYSANTILSLAKLGNVILVGRAAFVIASGLDTAFHVRLIASLDKRIEQVCSYYQLGPRAARKFIQDEDRQRKRYVQRYFGRDVEDPLLYHLTINTENMPYKEAARIIGDAVLRRRSEAKPQTVLAMKPSSGANPPVTGGFVAT